MYLNLLVYHRNIFGSSSKVFGNLRKSSDIFGNFGKFTENVRERSSGLRNNFGKSSEIFGKWSEIFGKSWKTSSSVSLQLFRERLSYKRGKAYATMPKVIMGNGSFYGCSSEPQGVSAWWNETTQTRIRFSFLAAESSWTSVKQSQNLTTHNANRHCRVRFYNFRGKTFVEKAVYNKQNNTWTLGDMEFIFSCSHSTSHSFAALTRSISMWTLEDKFHISARPCIILYIILSSEHTNVDLCWLLT